MRNQSDSTPRERRRGQEATTMTEDTQSTDAQWGTPANTASFSSIDSRPQSPQAPSPPPEDQQPTSTRSASRHSHNSDDDQDVLFPDRSRSPHEGGGDPSQLSSHSRLPHSNQQGRHSDDDEDHVSRNSTQLPTPHEVMRRYSQSAEQPWNPAFIGGKRAFPDVGSPDRSHKDKMQNDLAKLEKGDDDEDGDGSTEKNKK